MSMFTNKKLEKDEESGNDETYNIQLRLAHSTDLSDVADRGCVSKGTDERGLPVMIFIPRIGFGFQDKSEEIIRRMLLLFIKTADEVVRTPYSIVYSHTNIHWLNQQPVVYEYYKMLPRKYKKNLQRIYIMHPQVGIKVFFEFSRVFLSQKFYSKLQFVETVADFQRIIPANKLLLPYNFLCAEDEDRNLKGSGVVVPLELTFEESLGTTRLLAKCTSYLRSHGGLRQVGIFRVAGDEKQLALVRNRLQPPVNATEAQKRAFISHVMVGVEDALPPCYLTQTFRGSKRGSTRMTPVLEVDLTIEQLSTVVISEINTVAQVIKMSLRELAVPVITFDSYDPLMEITLELEAKRISMEAWYDQVFAIIGSMPHCNSSTFAYLMDFLREVDTFSDVNSMDCSNLAIVFAPTLFRPQTTDYSNTSPSNAAKAFNEVRLAQVILKNLLVQDVQDRVQGINTLARQSLAGVEKSLDLMGLQDEIAAKFGLEPADMGTEQRRPSFEQRPSFGSIGSASGDKNDRPHGTSRSSTKSSRRRSTRVSMNLNLAKNLSASSFTSTSSGPGSGGQEKSHHSLNHNNGSKGESAEDAINAGLSPHMLRRLHQSSRQQDSPEGEVIHRNRSEMFSDNPGIADIKSQSPLKYENPSSPTEVSNDESVIDEWALLEAEAAREAERIKREDAEGWTPVNNRRSSRRWS